jgi:hypothetical protein
MFLISLRLLHLHSFTVQKGAKSNFELIRGKSHGMSSLSISFVRLYAELSCENGRIIDLFGWSQLNFEPDLRTGVKDQGSEKAGCIVAVHISIVRHVSLIICNHLLCHSLGLSKRPRTGPIVLDLNAANFQSLQHRTNSIPYSELRENC